MKKIFITLGVMALFCGQNAFAQDLKKEPSPVFQLGSEVVERDSYLDALADAQNTEKDLTLGGRIAKYLINEENNGSRLLKEPFSLKFERGPVETMNFFSDFQGFASSTRTNGDWTTVGEYNRFGFADVGATGKFRHVPVDYKFMFNLKQNVDGKGNPSMTFMQGFFLDNFVTLTAIPHHKVTFGHQRTPVGVEGCASPYTLPLISRSQISRTFGNTRGRGLKLEGTYSLMNYNLGFYDSDKNFYKFFAGPEFAGWVNFTPLGKTDGKFGKITLGGGLDAGNRDNKMVGGDTDFVVGGAYAGYEYKKLKADFEYSIADGYNAANVSAKRADGFYSTLSYKITPKLELVGRYDKFNANRTLYGSKSAVNNEYSAGLNWRIRGDALRVLVNYVFVQPEAVGKHNSHRIMLGTQVML